LEHRRNLRQSLWKDSLPKGSTVHHKDRNPLNNTEGNLELWVGGHPSGARWADLEEVDMKKRSDYELRLLIRTAKKVLAERRAQKNGADAPAPARLEFGRDAHDL